MTDEQRQYLDFVQTTINRLNSNSFQIKGFAITIISALLAIYASEKNPDFLLVIIFPCFIFWLMDAYYLTLEKKYRLLFQDVLKDIKNNTNQIEIYSMEVKRYEDGLKTYFDVIKSKTILYTYLPVTIVVFILYCYSIVKK